MKKTFNNSVNASRESLDIIDSHTLKNLIDKKYLHINEKKLITFNAKDSAFITTKGMVNKNMISLSNFIYKVFNQIRIINS